ncbi:hypothetical protein A1O3_01211 [Capronia epimyces CBS 606.96]|uniref:Anaphase-promoting complex subunit 4 n=1 Tax=Capronia epimyces CBS 606.96 TaxID=1182542 RepID=W9ZDR0_9EURO|nr:uncharacterized protein A1O3_01211 [Capronia epimyces CBS 606.96]EXJ92659.1 hypothetical protein A1O3_01211 [Capronia epimyces CBS 606.96]
MDLIATVTTTGHGDRHNSRDVVDVWRLNGQRVFGATFEKGEDHDGDDAGPAEQVGKRTRMRNGDDRKQGGFVRAVSWRRDGQILAVACADGSVSLINAFTGKIAHRLDAARNLEGPTTATMSFSSSQSSQSRAAPASSSGSKSIPPPVRPATISSISWTKHFAFPNALTIRSRLNQSGSKVSLDQLLGLKADMENILQIAADLPQALSAIDIEDSLPKLATLPPLGAAVDDDVFSSRASIDAIFHSDGSSGSAGSGVGDVDALLVGMQTEEGGCAVNLKIFDSFEVGTIEVEGRLRSRVGTRHVVGFGGHPFLSTVFVVVEHSNPHETPDSSLHLISLDLSFITQTGRNLPLVARKATRLANLLRYIAQIQTQLRLEVKAAFDLPARFLHNIDESLAEGDPNADFVYAAHHLAVTGECLPRLKEWLVDEVGERGLKRWEKSVGDCLDLVRRMTSQNLMPALETCQAILSRLDGLAKYGPTSSKLGLDEKVVGRVRETVDALTILAEDLLLDVGTEIKEFTAFMKWMKFECEVEALEEGSERAEELRESWTGESEIMMVLEYVSGAMKETRLKKYVALDGTEQDGGRDVETIDEDTDAGFYTNYIKRRSGGKPLPSLGAMVERLQKQSDIVFGQVAETFRKSILGSYLFEFSRGCVAERMDIRVIPEQNDVSLYRLVAMFKNDKAFRVVSIRMRLDGGKNPKVEDRRDVSSTIPEVEEILDAKIVDDRAFLVLAATTADVRIYQMAIDTAEERDDWEVRQIFEEGRMHAGLKPARLEINGREGRRAVTVVDEAGMGFLVLDLDGESDVGQRDDEEGAGDEMSTG